MLNVQIDQILFSQQIVSKTHFLRRQQLVSNYGDLTVVNTLQLLHMLQSLLLLYLLILLNRLLHTYLLVTDRYVALFTVQQLTLELLSVLLRQV
jgi:hypothetical protein